MRNLTPLLVFCTLLSACATPIDSPQTTARTTQRLPASTVDDNAPPRLRWLPSGRYLRVADRWLLDNTGNFISLPPLPSDHSLILSPDAKQIAVFGDSAMRVGPLQGNLGTPIPIPLWIESKTTPIQRSDIYHTAYWLDSEHLFIQQIHPDPNTQHACRVYQTTTQRWRKPANGCIDARNAHTIHNILSGPDNLLLLTSSKRGRLDLFLTRYSSVEGNLPAKTPHLDLFPSGPVEASFGKQGTKLLLATPCALDSKSDPPCLNVHHDTLWKVYVFDIASGLLSMRDFNLPRGAAPHPNIDSFAWVQGQQICIGDPRAKLPPNCIDLPKDPTLPSTKNP